MYYGTCSLDGNETDFCYAFSGNGACSVEGNGSAYCYAYGDDEELVVTPTEMEWNGTIELETPPLYSLQLAIDVTVLALIIFAALMFTCLRYAHGMRYSVRRESFYGGHSDIVLNERREVVYGNPDVVLDATVVNNDGNRPRA